MGNRICAISTPKASFYFQEIGGGTLTGIGFAVAATALVLVLYAAQLYQAHRYISDDRVRRKLQWLLALFPVGTFCSLIGVCVPRALPYMDSFILLFVSRALFTFIELVRSLFGSRQAMADSLASQGSLRFASRPLCCCCVCLPQLAPTPKNMRLVEGMVLQMGILRVATMFIEVVALANDPLNGGGTVTTVLSSLNTVSTLVAMYGCSILIAIAKDSLAPFRMTVLFAGIQATIMFVNLQSSVIDLLASAGVIRCNLLLTSASMAQLVQHFALVFELFLLDCGVSYAMRPQRSALFDRHETNRGTLVEGGGEAGGWINYGAASQAKGPVFDFPPASQPSAPPLATKIPGLLDSSG